jgi:hypothetical protein
MKRIAVLAGALLFIISFGFSQEAAPAVSRPKFSLKLGGGASYATLGDLGRGIDGQMVYLKDEYGDISGAYDTPLLGLSSGGELLYNFSRRFAVGLAAGYVRHAKASQVSYSLGFIDVQERIAPKLNVIPVELNLHYYFPLGRRIALDLFAGAGYYLAQLDYEYRMDLSLTSLGLDGYDLYTFKSRRGAAGFPAGLGIEVALGSRMALSLDILGRYASITDFKGDWTEEGGGDFWEYDDGGSDHTMWFYVWTYGDKAYDQVAFQTDKPFGSLVSDTRPAKLDLTGVVATLSLKIRLF